MSADNWGICPRCKARAIKAREAKQLAAGAAYGKVPSADYLKMLADVEVPLEHEETLREDYDVRTGEDGEFCVSYGCSCEECGFKHSFKHAELLPVN